MIENLAEVNENLQCTPDAEGNIEARIQMRIRDVVGQLRVKGIPQLCECDREIRQYKV